MNNFQLYIEDELADIGAATKLFLNRTFLDMGDISKRGLLFTNVLTLPATHRNERIFGFPFHGKAKPPSFLLLYRHQVIGNGVIDVQSFNRQKGIKIQLVLDSGFWREAEELMLNDLVLDDYDFLFKDLKEDGFSNRIFNKGKTYQLVTAGSADLFTPRPNYAFKPLIDLISERLGYSIDYGDTLEKTDIRQTGCISNAKDLLVYDYKVRFLNHTIPRERHINFNDGHEIYKAGHTVIYNVKKYLTTTTIGNTLVSTLKPPEIPLYLIMKGFITTPGIGEVIIKGRKTLDGAYSEVSKFYLSNERDFYNYISPEIDITKYAYLRIQFPEGVLLKDLTISTAYKESSIFKYRETECKEREEFLKKYPLSNIKRLENGYARKGYYTDISDFYVLSDYNLPNLTCKDFLREIMKMNFLAFDINENKKEIKITPLGKNIDAKNSVDLSNRIEDVKLTYATPKYFASKNTLSYNNDKDVGESGKYAFLSDDIKGETKEFLKVESFSSSQNYEKNVFFYIYDIAKNTRKELTDRVVYTKGENVYFSPLSMEEIYTKYYKNLVDNTAAECTLNINLDFAHFGQLADSPLFYVSGLAQHFLALSIEGFDGVGLCKVKCVKYG